MVCFVGGQNVIDLPLLAVLCLKVRWNAVLTKWITGSEDGTIRIWVWCGACRVRDTVYM